MLFFRSSAKLEIEKSSLEVLMKRLVTILLTIAMIFTIVIPAVAAEQDAKNGGFDKQTG